MKAERGGKAAAGKSEAGRGWCLRLQERRHHRSKKVRNETSSADVEAAASYPGDLGKIIHEGGYHKPQIFSVEGTVFYWKKMPSKTFTAREKSTPGFKS